MASLDNLEGDAIEGMSLVLFVILIVIVYLAYKSISGVKLPKIPSVDEIIAKIKALLASLMPSPGSDGLWGPNQTPDDGAQVYIGSDQPVKDDQALIAEMKAAGLSDADIAQYMSTWTN